jgi:NADPH-dependent 2,4-dienoyl-CoA reductase/sulfur reductase-like enzyme
MKRREFMVQSAVAVLGLSACAREAPSRLPGGVAGSGAPKKVVVIGAGLAGLSAAGRGTHPPA